jgi:hypothetical protein
MDETMIPILGMLFVFGFPVAAFVVHRILKHQERMEMLRRGYIPPPSMRDKAAYKAWQEASAAWQPGAARWNPGAAPPPPPPMPPMPPPGWVSPEDDPQRALYKGIRLAFIGLALVIGISMVAHRGPWILGGLIPMFVGIAQIIVAVLSGAQLPGVMPRTTFMPPPQQPPHPGAGTPPPGFASNGMPWEQPKPARQHYEELSKPAPPPDQR